MAANSADRPRSLPPIIDTRSASTAASTARRSSTCCSSVGGSTTGSDRPVPRRSNMISRANSAIRRNVRAVRGSSHISSRCEAGPVITHQIARTLAQRLVGDAGVAAVRVMGRWRAHFCY